MIFKCLIRLAKYIIYVMLIGTVTGNDFIFIPFLRSAYITFAAKESVDRAVALSGTTFISRVVKVCLSLIMLRDHLGQ